MRLALSLHSRFYLDLKKETFQMLIVYQEKHKHEIKLFHIPKYLHRNINHYTGNNYWTNWTQIAYADCVLRNPNAQVLLGSHYY
jgi:hypothetical protein